MVTVATVIGAIIVGLALLVYAGFLAARYFFVPRYPDELHYARTADGWRIALTRYRPMKPGSPEPLLLVHGLGANRYNFDLTDDYSLARTLAAAGYDVWLVELRGRGYSMRPRLFSGVRYDWSFDEYAEQDLPAAAQAILRATSAQRLHLVGFSIGALASYAWLSDPHRATEIGSLVSIAGPATFRRAGSHLSGRVVRQIRWLRHRFLMRVLAPISGYFHPSPLHLIHNPENTDGYVQRRAMVNLIANFSRNELLQYGDWLCNDTFRSIDHRRDYRAELPRITVPTLFLAGARDLLAPPDAVKDAFEAVGATDKRFVICSRAQKFSVNYGHFDLLLGNHAAREIYPLVLEWLDAHAPSARAQALTPAAEPTRAATDRTERTAG
ncbi:MAG: alpha/beta fold hydrolase [Myxococcales bacterium]|nr:alpha/beta fold hydrolase [Myxococcales bacterium]